jgi:hypothetical protein
VTRGAKYTSYKHLSTGRNMGTGKDGGGSQTKKGRMSLTKGLTKAGLAQTLNPKH